MYVVPDDYVKSNAEKKLSIVSLNPKLLEKNEIFGVSNVSNLPYKSHSTLNLVENLEKKLEGQKGCDNNAFISEKEKVQDKKPLERQLSIQVRIFPSSTNYSLEIHFTWLNVVSSQTEKHNFVF